MSLDVSSPLTRFGYPKSPGDTPWSCIEIRGPLHYVPITPESPPPVVPVSGGQSVLPSDFALQNIHFAGALAASTGQYAVIIIPVPGGDGTFRELLLQWINIYTMEQAVDGENLSGNSVRLWAVGN